MNVIQKEFVKSEDYMIATEEYCSNTLVILSPENVAKAEAMMRTDSSYRKSFDKTAGKKGKYNGSSAYWFSQLNEIIAGALRSKDGYDFEKIVQETINAIDRENSTHLNADEEGRETLKDRIMAFGIENMLKVLGNGELELYEELRKPTNPKNGCSPRSNQSFASKFCHYACYYLFEGKTEQDNYSIYDNVIRKVLPVYAIKYNVKFKTLTDYKEYRRTVDAIIVASGNAISRNGFDHLLWYYHKGR